MIRTAVHRAALAFLTSGTLALPVSAAEPTAVERVVALKAHLAESQSVLRQYEWIETTAISVERFLKIPVFPTQGWRYHSI